LRFFAIAFVIFGHALERAERFFPQSQPWLTGSRLGAFLQIAPPGVMLFFAISGFVLSSQAIKAKASPLSGAFLKSYFGRRVLRIEPPYIIVLTATLAVVGLAHFTPEGTHRFDAAPASLTLSYAGAVFYLHDLIWGSFPRLFPPGWSLEVEVQFYILAPLLFAVWRALPGVGERLVLTGLVAVSAVNVGLLRLTDLGPLHVEYSLLNYFNYFWIGIAMAHLREPLAAWLARRPDRFASALGWGGLVVFVAFAAPGDRSGLVAEAARLGGAYAGLAAVFASTFDPRSSLRGFCASPWISLIGGACYSIYLLHLQIVHSIFVAAAKAFPHLPVAGVFALFVVSSAAAVAAGLIYYVQIERRFMARDWPSQLAAFFRRRPGGLQLVVDNRAPAGTVEGRPADKRRSAATRP
jgi:peptidoglycan/LPS O-acetylase OafA/YrhL